MEQKELDKLLKFDGLHTAEKITGGDYKQDDSVAWLGMALQMANNKKASEILTNNDDTLFSNKVNDYIRKIESIGFKQIYVEDFVYTPDYGDKTPQNERMFVFFQYELGILLSFDTFNGDGVNGGSFYYNWSPNTKQGNSCTSSGAYIFGDGHIEFFNSELIDVYPIENLPILPKYDYGNETWEEFNARKEPIEKQRREIFDNAIELGARNIWVGYHDCREAVKHNITMLKENGRFVPTWHECAFPWICNFSEFKKDSGLESHYEATKIRLAKFPKDVLNQIGAYKK